MRNDEARKTVLLLYHPPMGTARTGHVGLLVTQEIDDTVKAVYYFSLYHALLPSAIRKMSWGERVSTSVPSTTVSSYEADVVMRGRSWVRMMDENKRENETVQDLMATLPIESELRETYFNRGVYKHTLRLPHSIDTDAVIAELERIKNTASWALVGPITRSLFWDATAYNCCSAVDAALQKGMQKPYQKGSLGSLIETSKKTLYMMYFMTILFSPDVTLSRDDPAMALWFVPAIYLVIQALRDTFNFIFMNDLTLTPLGKIEGAKLYFLSAFFSVMNLLCMPLAVRATDAFIYPTSLARKVEKEYGGELSNAGFVDLPRLEMC
ncbi:MAG: hypothetical protein Q8L78_03145 [Coxiellaceae bacterium]|nr:hypothetical protein [Coxiellaceae bacterium]